VAETSMCWQRNLNLCGSPRSCSESRRPLDVISVCTRPGRHASARSADRVGPYQVLYQPPVPGAERASSAMFSMFQGQGERLTLYHAISFLILTLAMPIYPSPDFGLWKSPVTLGVSERARTSSEVLNDSMTCLYAKTV